MAELTHWKKYDNPDYLGAYSLQPGEEPIYTIKRVTHEVVKGEGGKKDECRIAHFQEKAKPMILNATNCKIITRLYGTPFVEEWAGKRIQIYSTTTKLAGEEVECLRIRPTIPAANKPVLDQSYKGWGAALEAVKNGETSLQYLESKYTIPPDCKKIMMEAVKCQTQAS